MPPTQEIEVQDHALEVVPADALERIERAQIDVQINTAKRFPRKMSVVKKEMLDLATLDQETAASCFYTLKRKGADGDKIIQGPSARMAEIATNAFGNMKAVARIIGNDGKMVTAQAVCHDLEKNVCIGVEVKRRITNKDGRIYSEDMQVVTGNAACSIALRNAVFKVIPMALVKPVYEAAKKAAVGTLTTLTSRRTEALEVFKKMGVSKERIFATLGITGVEEIGLAQLEVLIGMHTAIKGGDSTVEESFPASAPKFKPSSFKAGEGAAPVTAPMPTTPTKESALEQLRKLCAEGSIDEAQLVKFMREAKLFDDASLSSLEEINDIQKSSIEAVVKTWPKVKAKLAAAAE